MYYSFEKEFPEIKDVPKAISNWEGTDARKDMEMYGDYAKGENTFITKFKRQVWDDKAEQLVDNVYAPNHKTCYGFFQNMVDQKVNALYGEMPSVEGIDKGERVELGFSLKSAGKRASVYGYSVLYEKYDGTYKSFNPLNCILYRDDKTGKLVRMIRYWHELEKNEKVLYFEVYDNLGITTYRKSANDIEPKLFIDLQSYKYKIESSSLSRTKTAINIDELPIAIYHNNEEDKSDLTKNVRFKIDMVDLLESGFVNNIEEFCDVWMSINVPGATPEEAQKIKETAKRTKAILFANSDDKNTVDFKTLEIPYQARQTAVQMIKEELIEDTGIIDFKQIQGNATATEINARTYKLQQRVSDFEWFSNKVATELIKIYQAYRSIDFEIDITFNKLFIKNNTEIINNANAVFGRISMRTYLKQLQLAGIVEDVDEELEALKEESVNKFNIEDLGGLLDGERTQTNEQDFSSNEENF